MKRTGMREDDLSFQVSNSQTMEQSIAILNLNLNQPLTDQLARHKFITQEERTQREGATEAKRPIEHDHKANEHGEDTVPINCDHIASEIVDLAVPKNPTGEVPLNSGNGKHNYCGNETNVYALDGKHQPNGYARSNAFERSMKFTPDHVNGSNGDDLNDQKSDRSRAFDYLYTERSKHSFHTTESATRQPEATGQRTAPQSPLKNTGDGGGLPGAKPGSAFLPVVDRRGFACGVSPSGYKAPGYPFCLLPFPGSTSMSAYPPMSHPLVQSNVKSPNAGTPLLSPPPYVLYPDAHSTRRLEVLWTQKYPRHPVPPVWMLHQYTDELLRDTGRLLPASGAGRLAGGREFFGSTPVTPDPGDAISSADKKRDKKEVRGDKNSVAMETRRADGQSKEELQTRKKTASKDRKNWRACDPDVQCRDQGRSSCEWYRSGQRWSEFFPGAYVVASHHPHHRTTELLVDKSAASTCDAVDQHFQESLLRLNSQNHLDKSRSGHSIQSGNREVLATDMHGIIYGNSGHQNWKDARCTAVDEKKENDVLRDRSDQTRSSDFSPASRLASKTQRNQPGRISFDIYGYQSQHRQVCSPERLRDALRKDPFSGKPDKSPLVNGYRDLSGHHFPDKNSEELHRRQDSRCAGPNPKVEVTDPWHDGWDFRNDPTRIFDRQSSDVCPTKRMNDVKLLTAGGQSAASPTPGSVVRDSRFGPSRLVAGSPRPLPGIFYNPLDPRMEPVQPYQVSIEQVERWPGTSPWMQSDWPVTSSNGTQQRKAHGISPETHLRIQQGLIPSPVHNPVVRGGEDLGFTAGTLESDQNQATVGTSYAADGAEPIKASGKRHVGRDDDGPHRLKRLKTEDSVCPRSEGSPLVSIDSFKSFVDQAVYNAFLEDSDKRTDDQNIPAVSSPIMTNFNLASIMGLDRQHHDTGGIHGRGFSSDDPGSVTTSVAPTSTSHSLTTSREKSPETAVKSGTSSGKSSSRVEPCSDILVAPSREPSVAADDDQKCDASCSTSSPASNFSLHHPTPLRSTPSPRATSASLHLKKAWLLRYSDVDQKPPSDASASSFPDAGAENMSDYEKHGFTDKPGSSSFGISRFLPFGEEAAEIQTGCGFGSAVDEANEAKPTAAGSVVSTSKPQSDKDTDSNSSSSVSVDSNISTTQNSRNSKRNSSSETPSMRSKLAKTDSSPKNSVTNGQNSRRMRGRNSKIVDDGAMRVNASDCDTKPSRLRKKTRVESTRSLDLKDGKNLTLNDRRGTTSEVFLQDGSCLKVAHRLPKCRECKVERWNKNGAQTGNICKFDVFRKLCYNSKGILCVAGFSEPPDITANDIDLWMPSKPNQTSLTLVQAQYLVTHLSEFFTHFLLQDTSLKFLESSEDESGPVLWRRPMESVQESCDACDIIVFDIHWTCKKCGFVVCNGCRSKRVALNDEEEEEEDEDEAEATEWPPCSMRRQCHDPNDLSLTQIISQDALSALMEKFSRSMYKSRRATETVKDIGINGKLLMEIKTEEDENETKQSNSTLDVGRSSPSVTPEDHVCASKPNIPIRDGSPSANARTSARSSPGCAGEDRGWSDSGDSPTANQEKMTDDFDVITMSSLDFNPVIETVDSDDALRLFQRRWCRSMAVMVRRSDKGPSSNLWKPETFLRKFSHLRLDLVNCLNGVVHRLQSSEKLWNGFKSSSSSSSSSSAKSSGLLQFKDWPLAEDWTGTLSSHCADLNRVLPISSYSLADGPFNLASHLPEFFHQPDLATRINVGYGSIAHGHTTLAKLQTNPVDFVNIVMFAESRLSNDSLKCDDDFMTQLLKDSGYAGDMSPENPEEIVAIWHIYHPMNSNKIQSFLDKTSGNMSRKTGEQNRACLPSENSSYLNADLRAELRNETGIQAAVVMQCLGDAVFVPATTFYQIKVIQECVSVTKEFISPESIESSFTKSTQSHWNKSKNSKQEHFQIKNLVYHTMKDCIGILDQSNSQADSFVIGVSRTNGSTQKTLGHVTS